MNNLEPVVNFFPLLRIFQPPAVFVNLTIALCVSVVMVFNY